MRRVAGEDLKSFLEGFIKVKKEVLDSIKKINDKNSILGLILNVPSTEGAKHGYEQCKKKVEEIIKLYTKLTVELDCEQVVQATKHSMNKNKVYTQLRVVRNQKTYKSKWLKSVNDLEDYENLENLLHLTEQLVKQVEADVR